MRLAAFSASILFALAACSTTTAPRPKSPYDSPNALMAAEISRRIDQIPYLHREELVNNLLWLVQRGEQVIPDTLEALHSESPKVRSSAAWVLGMIGDRRTIPQLREAVQDSDPSVRLECARSLVLLGDLEQAPVLIEGLDSDHKEVRLLCHEALKKSTGHDFGYDHLAMNVDERHGSVLRWRQWWSDYSGDAVFARNYQERFGLGMPAAPVGETGAPDRSETAEAEETVEAEEGAGEEESPETSRTTGEEVQVTPVIEIEVAPSPDPETPEQEEGGSGTQTEPTSTTSEHGGH